MEVDSPYPGCIAWNDHDPGDLLSVAEKQGPVNVFHAIEGVDVPEGEVFLSMSEVVANKYLVRLIVGHAEDRFLFDGVVAAEACFKSLHYEMDDTIGYPTHCFFDKEHPSHTA